jgi:hypothetical protein
MSFAREDKSTPYSDAFLMASGLDHLKINVSTLTTAEVDTKGYLKPNLPFLENGDLVSSTNLSVPAAAVANDENTGTGTVGSLVGKAGGVSEVITLRAIDATHFDVIGSRSGLLGDATVGTPYTSAAINLTITAGGTAFVAGDEFTIKITAADEQRVWGLTREAVKIVDENPTDDSLAADTSDPLVGVATFAHINRDIAEDNLGRAFTALELTAMKNAGHIVVTTT